MGFLSKLKHHAQTLMGNHKEIIEETKSAVDTAEKVVDTAKKVKKTAKKAKVLLKRKLRRRNESRIRPVGISDTFRDELRVATGRFRDTSCSCDCIQCDNIYDCV